MSDKVNVMFVCLGNICRSPIAGALFQHMVNEQGLQDKFGRIESSGTGAYHVGEKPDPRSQEVCKAHGVKINSRAQQIAKEHFHEFDYIYALDANNLRNLKAIQPKGSKAVLEMLGPEPVPDPYYAPDGFDSTYNTLKPYLETRLDEITSK